MVKVIAHGSLLQARWYVFRTNTEDNIFIEYYLPRVRGGPFEGEVERFFAVSSEKSRHRVVGPAFQEVHGVVDPQ